MTYCTGRYRIVVIADDPRERVQSKPLSGSCNIITCAVELQGSHNFNRSVRELLQDSVQRSESGENGDPEDPVIRRTITHPYPHILDFMN